MNRNLSLTEHELIAIELSEFARDIVEAISKPYNDGPKAVAALLNGRLTNLKHSYAEEARRAPQHAKAGDRLRIHAVHCVQTSTAAASDRWPTVDRADLHLPLYPAPEGKAHTYIDGDIAAWWDGECYRAYERKTKQFQLVTEADAIAEIREELDRP